MIRLELGVWGPRPQGCKVRFHYILSRVPTVNMIYHYDVDLGWVVFVRFLHYEVKSFFLLFHTVLFGRKSICTAHTKGVKNYNPPPWRQSTYLHNYLEFCARCLSVLPRLFIYLIVYFYLSGLMDVCFVLWIIIQYYFVLLRLYQLWPQSSFSWFWFLYRFDVPPSLWGLWVLPFFLALQDAPVLEPQIWAMCVLAAGVCVDPRCSQLTEQGCECTKLASFVCNHLSVISLSMSWLKCLQLPSITTWIILAFSPWL